MSSSMNQNTNQPDPMHLALAEAIDACLTDGMPVLDANGEKVGNVKMYSIAAGYLMVGTGPFEEEALYLPLRLVRSIDPHVIVVSECKDVLLDRYNESPTFSTIVERRMVPGPPGGLASQTHEAHAAYEVQELPSGYDNKPTEITSLEAGSIMDWLAVGMVVYDVKGERLGETTRYDVPRGMMVVEKGIFNPTVLRVSLSAIREIHPEKFSIYLALPRTALMQEHTSLPADA